MAKRQNNAYPHFSLGGAYIQPWQKCDGCLLISCEVQYAENFATEVQIWVEDTMRYFGVICMYCLYDLVVSHVIKEANIKKNSMGKNIRGI